MAGEENRVHSRIQLLTEIEVLVEGHRVKAMLQDLSKGGARFVIKEPYGQVGDVVHVFLPSLGGHEIEVGSEVVRVRVEMDGNTLAVRFMDVDPERRQELIDLCDQLLSTSAGGGARRHPRVARRLQIRFGDLLSLKGILKNISQGGLAMTVEESLVLHEEIEVAVPDTGGEQMFVLKAQVVRIHPVEGGGYDVGLQFLPLRPETQRCLQEFLRYLVEIDGPQG